MVLLDLLAIAIDTPEVPTKAHISSNNIAH